MTVGTRKRKNILKRGGDIVPVLTVNDDEDADFLRMECSGISRRMMRSDLLKSLCDKLKATVTDPSQDGVGIAGPQIGIGRRIVCVQRFDKEGEPFEVYPNIRITAERGEKEYGPEGCLSVPDRRGQIPRSRDIDISYTSERTLKDTTERITGFTAVIFQHECDHLDGVLYTDRIWGDENAWFTLRGADPKPNEGFADIFYLVSTNIFSERSEKGDTLFLASLTPDERAVLSREMGHVAKHVFCDSLNFFAPFYHQHTVEALELCPMKYNELKKQLAAETYESFCYYLEHFNEGRPFILAGFSQGAMLVKEILKRMTPEQYSRMAAAYVLGWGLNEDDMKHPCIKPAQAADDFGVTISYNSVADTTGIWNLVMDDSRYCINPVNWKTDSTPAEFTYQGQPLQAHIDKSNNVLVIDNFEEEHNPFATLWPNGCLHHYEFLFFGNQLRDNAKLRVNGLKRAANNSSSLAN